MFTVIANTQAQSKYDKVPCEAEYKLPICIITSSGGGMFGLKYGNTKVYHPNKTNFLKIARKVKELQFNEQCEGAVIKSAISKAKVCEVREEPATCSLKETFGGGAIVSFKNNLKLDSSSSLFRDDYLSLRNKYIDLLPEIGLCHFK